MFSATRAFVENVRLRLGFSKQGEVLNTADDVRRMMDKGSCVGTHPGNGEQNSSPKINPDGSDGIPKHDLELCYFHRKYQIAPEGSEEKTKALQNYQNVLQRRSYVDSSVGLIVEFLFGTTEKASSVMEATPHVDDWIRCKPMVDTYQKHFRTFSPYGLKHMQSILNMCNAGVEPEDLAKATAYASATLGEIPPEPKEC